MPGSEAASRARRAQGVARSAPTTVTAESRLRDGWVAGASPTPHENREPAVTQPLQTPFSSDTRRGELTPSRRLGASNIKESEGDR
jgi:hypothetical protein